MEPIRIHFELNRTTKGRMDLKAGNEMINANDTLHFTVKSELAAHLRSLANTEARQYVGDLGPDTYLFTRDHPCYILVHISPPSNRRMDAPNWYPTIKPLIDGLTDMHMFEDDNDHVITSFTFLPESKTNNKKYRIILEIRKGHFPGWNE